MSSKICCIAVHSFKSTPAMIGQFYIEIYDKTALLPSCKLPVLKSFTGIHIFMISVLATTMNFTKEKKIEKAFATLSYKLTCLI